MCLSLFQFGLSGLGPQSAFDDGLFGLIEERYAARQFD
jgi:hypothetical protein